VSRPFENLRERLLRAGVAPRHVQRYLRELSDHYEDVVVAGGGLPAQQALYSDLDGAQAGRT
jgi:hypothetical protein